MRKFILTALILTLVLSGCELETENELKLESINEPVTISFWHAMSGKREEVLQNLTNNYNNSQSNVTVELINQGDYNTLQQKLMQSSEANNLPQIAQAYSNWIPPLINNDDVVDLTSFFSDENYGVDVENYIDSFISESKIDDKYYGVPFNKSTEVLFYNKELVDKNTADEMSNSFSELITESNQLTSEYDIVGSGYASLANFFAITLKECGVDSWFDSNGKAMFYNECVITKLTTYQEAIEQGFMRTATNDEYLHNVFGAEEMATYVGTTSGQSYVTDAVDDKFEWGVTTYPGEVAVQQGTNIVFFKNSNNAEISAAWDYVKYLTSDENTIDWSIETGYMPVTKSAYENEKYIDYSDENPVAYAAKEQLDKLQLVVPVNEWASEIYGKSFIEFMTSILVAQNDVETEIQKLVENAEAIYDRNN